MFVGSVNMKLTEWFNEYFLRIHQNRWTQIFWMFPCINRLTGGMNWKCINRMLYDRNECLNIRTPPNTEWIVIFMSICCKISHPSVYGKTHNGIDHPVYTVNQMACEEIALCWLKIHMLICRYQWIFRFGWSEFNLHANEIIGKWKTLRLICCIELRCSTCERKR